MTNPSDVADAYLASRFNTRLEQVLLDLIDDCPLPARAALTGVKAERFDTRRHPDGSVSEGYTGRLSCRASPIAGGPGSTAMSAARGF